MLAAVRSAVQELVKEHGRERITVPLLTLFGAANEIPEDDELAAIYDRFLVRFVVGYVVEDWRFLRMLRSSPAVEGPALTRAVTARPSIVAWRASAHRADAETVSTAATVVASARR